MTDEHRREPQRPGPDDTPRDRESGAQPTQPEPGTDSRVEDWYGQSVARDAALADELTEQLGPDEAEREFERRATGREEQEARHGREVDPDGGQDAYRQQ